MTIKLQQPSRNPKTLLTEVDALIKVRDIREWENLKQQVSVKWWESGILAVLFLSGLGTLITLYKLVPDNSPLPYEFVLLWFGLFTLTLLGSIEFLILKFRALRRMHETTSRIIDDQQATLKALRDYLEAREEAEHPTKSD